MVPKDRAVDGRTSDTTVSLLDREVYSMSQADRLLRLTRGTTRRWVDGYDNRGKSYEPLIRDTRTGAEMVTWGEYVEARLISEYRQLGARVFHLRAAIMELKDKYQNKYPLAYSAPLVTVSGQDLILQIQEQTHLQPALHLMIRSGQLRLPSLEVAAFQKSAEYDEASGEAARINITRTITVDPSYSSGEPTVKGRRLRVASIIESVEAGETREEIRETWSIDDEVIDDAIRCVQIA